MAYLLYNLMLYIGVALLWPAILLRLILRKRDSVGIKQKLGSYPKRFPVKTIWIHSVSVGEVLAVEGLVRELATRPLDRKLVLTVTTQGGMEVAKNKLSDVAEIFFFPYDFLFAVNRAVKAINPALFVTVDTEIWPNVFKKCREANARVAIINGRISDKSYKGYLKNRWLFSKVLAYVDMFLMQSQLDGERIMDVGAQKPKVSTVGNLKYDNILNPATMEERRALRRSLGIEQGERVVFLGNIHKGEEAAIEGFFIAREALGDLRLVIAPRRIENIGWIKKALGDSWLKVKRKSEMDDKPDMAKNITPVIDTFGELARLWAVADVAFVGGSLIDHGGQNPLEPAAHGIAPMFGPSMRNFRDVSGQMLGAGAAFEAPDAKAVGRTIVELFSNDEKRINSGQAAMDVISRNRGVNKIVADKLIALMNQ